MTKAKEGKTDYHLAMLCMRATPLSHQLQSPAELLYNKKIKSNLPTKIENKHSSRDEIYQQLKDNQDTQKWYHDRGARKLASLIPGQQVLVQNDKTMLWEKGVIEKIREETRSYEVKTPSHDDALQHNQRHLREVAESKETSQENLPVQKDVASQLAEERPRRAITKPRQLIEEV